MAGPSRRMSRHLRASAYNALRRRHMSVVHGGGHGFGEHVGNIVVGVYLAHLDESMRDTLDRTLRSDTPINMSRVLARAALLGQLDRSAVVD
eukprot:6213703-Pleurochrysis_carterae.AAC.1